MAFPERTDEQVAAKAALMAANSQLAAAKAQLAGKEALEIMQTLGERLHIIPRGHVLTDDQLVTIWRESMNGLTHGMMSKRVEILDHEEMIRELLKSVGEDPDRGGLRETPARFLKALAFYCSGYGQDPASVMKCFEDGADGVDELVVVSDLPVYSTCEHHIAPFFGKVHIGYIPQRRVLGLSKFARLVEIYARRLQVQERLTNQIADAIQEYLQPLGCGVVITANHLCHSQDTEVLTDKGFKHFDALAERERIAQYDRSTGEISFVVPNGLVAAKYSGPMHNWKGKSFDMLVTPEHRCLVSSEWKYPRYGLASLDFVKAKDVVGRQYMPRAGIYQPNVPNNTVELAGETLTENQFCGFIGLFLAEGWAGNTSRSQYRITIPQSEISHGFTEIRKLIRELPFRFGEFLQRPGHWHFCCNNKKLMEYFIQFGLCRDKYIPESIFNASLEGRNSFLKYYLLGDGWRDPVSVQLGAGTRSKALAHDLQRLWTISGFGCGVTSGFTGGDTQWFARAHLRNGTEPRTDSMVREDQRSIDDYEGMVYCVNVPKGALITRRNGTVVVSGNCMECRGVQKIGAKTTTSALRGVIKERAEARAEFLSFVRNGKR